MIIQEYKEKLFQEFKDKYVKNRFNNELSTISEKFKNNQEIIENELLSSFKENCKKAEKLQKENLKGKMKYIYFSFLRTNILESKGDWRIDFFDGRWFLDSEECSSDMDFVWIYEDFFKYINKLMDKRKEYGRAIREMDIEKIKLEESNKYNGIAMQILAQLINQFMECDEYKNIDKDEEIIFFAGEYMDDVVILYDGSKEQNEVETV